MAFIGGIGLLGVALLTSMTSAVPDQITTVAAIIGVAGMIYGVATGTLMVFDRRSDEWSARGCTCWPPAGFS
jgi:hypothetical protein